MINTGKILIIRDELEIKQAVKVNDILMVIRKFDDWLRNEAKYNGREYETEEPGKDGKKTVRDILRELLYDNGINMDELYY